MKFTHEIDYFRNAGCKKGEDPILHLQDYFSGAENNPGFKKMLFLTSILPTKYAFEFFHWWPDNVDNLETIQKLKNKNLFLYGKPGTGKTFAGIAAYLSTIKNWKSVIRLWKQFQFHTTSSILREIRLSYQIHNLEKLIIQSLIDVPFLMLDDFGMEKSTEFANSTLEDILNERYNNSRITIITSNYSPESLSKKIGSNRIVSRILEEGVKCEFTENKRNKPKP